MQLSRRVHNPRAAATCLMVLAWVTAAGQDVRRAAVLMGAAEELVQSVGSATVLFPKYAAYQEECMRATRRALGDRGFEAAIGEGRALGFGAAIAYALDEPAPVASSSAEGPAQRLTKRERQVAELVAEGLTNKAIAARLVISQRTAQGHVEHVLAKLGFTSRTQIAAWVVENAARDEH
jgi:non-specific serine/threonine protein kinase